MYLYNLFWPLANRDNYIYYAKKLALYYNAVSLELLALFGPIIFLRIIVIPITIIISFILFLPGMMNNAIITNINNYVTFAVTISAIFSIFINIEEIYFTNELRMARIKRECQKLYLHISPYSLTDDDENFRYFSKQIRSIVNYKFKKKLKGINSNYIFYNLTNNIFINYFLGGIIILLVFFQLFSVIDKISISYIRIFVVLLAAIISYFKIGNKIIRLASISIKERRKFINFEAPYNNYSDKDLNLYINNMDNS